MLGATQVTPKLVSPHAAGELDLTECEMVFENEEGRSVVVRTDYEIVGVEV